MNLSEQYRPRSWDQVVGQKAALAVIDGHRRNGGLCGRAYWLCGTPGLGKTTTARLIAQEVGGDWSTEELDASKIDVDTLDRWEREAHSRPIDGGGWCKIVNEAGSLRKPIVRRLLSFLEQEAVMRNMTVVFTAMPDEQQRLFDTVGGDVEKAFGSRVDVVEFKADIGAAAQRAREVAQAIGRDGQPLKAYYALAVDCDCNLREMLRRVERGDQAAPAGSR